MLLKAEDEQPCLSQAQQGHLLPRAAALRSQAPQGRASLRSAAGEEGDCRLSSVD